MCAMIPGSRVVTAGNSRGPAAGSLPKWPEIRDRENEIRTRPIFIATLVAAVSATVFSTRAAADPGAGFIVGGTIGAIVGGPPGAVVGAMIGTAIGHDDYYYRHGYAYGPPPGYAPPPPVGYYAPPPAYYAPPPVAYYAPPPVTYYAPAPRYYAPRVVYVQPGSYYGPRRAHFRDRRRY